MIKRLIFDVDNTLIKWIDEYLNAIKETIEEYAIDVDYMKVNDIIEEYENYYDKYTIENMKNLLNEKLNLNVDEKFIEDWLDKLASITKYDSEVYNTVEYLSKKYELVILSNWFNENQKARLEKARLLKFFKEFYCGDELKPNEKAFNLAMGHIKKEECIMVGDNYQIDIYPSLKLGMKAIMITDKKIKEDNLTCIEDVMHLRAIL